MNKPLLSQFWRKFKTYGGLWVFLALAYVVLCWHGPMMLSLRVGQPWWHGPLWFHGAVAFAYWVVHGCCKL